MNFVPNATFKRPNAERRLFSVTVRRISGSWYIPFLLGEQDSVQRQPDQPWSREEERAIFLQWNFARSKAARSPRWERRAEQLQGQITEANLGLVCSMVMKHAIVDGDRDDAISEGQSAMLRAMDKFDVRKGYKFSTYACAAIFRSLVRRYQSGAKRVKRFGVPHDERMDRPVVDESTAEDVAHLRVAIERTDLSDQEVVVLDARFFESPTRTLESIGQDMGLSKERVRQIEAAALAKLRRSFDRG